MSINDQKLKELGVSIEDTPTVFIIHLGTLQMNILLSFKDESPESLESLSDHYAITGVTDMDRSKVLIIYDILKQDIDDPHDIQNYIYKKRQYQTMCKYAPNIAKTFFYESNKRDLLIKKIKDAIDLAFKTFEGNKDFIDTSNGIIISTSCGNISNFHMEELINEVIHTYFVVISEITNNELCNKYYLINKKENEENDNDAN